ncbi:hypothetical protein K461DRAFT_152863 [Myriangium duriaei CBS 260.36]|uniref:Uncharacterized protein n=1 Tax=Myriangium duriaei CBS 260.36 TaxID=1168546 RepID=A0A9P4J5J8_9PEZI|nr:hypothetical protein K461DRAFT_152863 [Myriangium duriaei CBS 260.36]
MGAFEVSDLVIHRSSSANLSDFGLQRQWGPNKALIPCPREQSPSIMNGMQRKANMRFLRCLSRVTTRLGGVHYLWGLSCQGTIWAFFGSTGVSSPGSVPRPCLSSPETEVPPRSQFQPHRRAHFKLITSPAELTVAYNRITLRLSKVQHRPAPSCRFRTWTSI